MKTTSVQPTVDAYEVVLSKIFNFTGQLSKLAQVSRLFKMLAQKQGTQIYRTLIEKYGFVVVSNAMKGLSLGNKSVLVRIDALFSKARKTAAANLPLTTSPYDIAYLKGTIDPYVESESLVNFWNCLFSQAPESLRQKMEALKFNSDALVCKNQIQSFLKHYKSELAQIKTLRLAQQDLKILPAEINYFTNLSTLDLSDNKLTDLPDLSGLKQLTSLNLNKNRLTILPSSIDGLTELRLLFLAENNLIYIHESIGNLSKLKILILSNNRLSVLPKTIGMLASLCQLSLECNKLNKLPESIGNLKNLKLLYLYNNELKTLPDSIEEMKSLTVLSAPKNQLFALPVEIGKLNNLQILMLDNNKLTCLPASLEKITLLKQLYVSDNLLDETPVLPALQRLGCDGNPCTQGVTNDSPGRKLEGLFLTNYDALGANKWKECIDGVYQSFGKYVFDQGLHGYSVEPGFVESMEKAFDFLRQSYGRRIDADFYLELHKIACSHFKGAATKTLIDEKNIGEFRNTAVSAQFHEPGHVLTEEAKNELNAINTQLGRALGALFSLGEFKQTSNAPKVIWTLNYQDLRKDQVRIIFNIFIAEFNADIASAVNSDGYLKAIAKLIQHLEWLHPPTDGCGRTDTALLNFLLANYTELNPVLLKYPYVSSVSGLDQWVAFLEQGMEDWVIEYSKT